MSDYADGLKLMARVGVPCKNCATASMWCSPCAAKWHKACEDQKRAEQRDAARTAGTDTAGGV